MFDFMFYSTTSLVGIFEKMLNSKLKVTGLRNVPKNSCLFVSNHFTRIETGILPYLLLKYCGKKVRSLADADLFQGVLGKYLSSVGCISIDDENKDDIIINDLINAKNDWLIYPEGLMLKNKLVTLKDEEYHFMNESKMRPVFTGAFTYALKTLLSKKENNLALDDFHVVPISIDYYPVRYVEKHPINKFFKDKWDNLSSRFKEEIAIEYYLVKNAEIHIKFHPAISPKEFFKKQLCMNNSMELFTQGKYENEIKKFTYKAMKVIYENCLITFDHIFTIVIYYLDKNFSIDYLKHLCFFILHKLKSSLPQINYHSYLLDFPYSDYFLDDFLFKNIFELAMEQNFILADGDLYKTNIDEFLKVDDFHSIRINRLLKLCYNQLEIFPNIHNEVKQYINISFSDVKKENFEIMNDKQSHEFIKDYYYYYNKKESSLLKIGKPFFLKGSSNVGVLLCHGYKSAPEEVRPLAEYLNSNGYSVNAIRLKGHGTHYHNMKDVVWNDWMYSVRKGFSILDAYCDKVIIAGFSTGGLLALLFAANYPNKVYKLVSINSALKLNDMRIKFTPIVNIFNYLLELLHLKEFKKEFIADIPENPHINYKMYYIKGLNQLVKLMHECLDCLKRVNSNSLIIQSQGDPTINNECGKIIYDNISSKQKQLYTPKCDRHTILYPTKKWNPRKIIYKKILDFLKK